MATDMTPSTRSSLSSLLAVLVVASAPATSAELPNIILAMADDQGWGDMAYMGHPVLKTPTFDEMARTALRFDRFYAAGPVCSPTRGSVLTGRHPNRFGCFKWGYSLRPQEITVAEALKKAGYLTGHFGKWHVGSVRADSPVSPGQSGFDEWLSSPNFFENSPWMSHRGRAVTTEGEGSMVTVSAALEFIRDAHRRDTPFLALVWFGSPHAPHVGIERDLELYGDQPEDQRHFLAEITAMDRAMGHLRSELRRLGIAENTLLWYTSDNGAIPKGSTGGLRGRKGTVWEGGLRVPAIIEWPARVRAPRTISVPCGTVDIYPTLLDIAGVAMADQPPLDGSSVVPLIDGRPLARPQPLGFWDYPIEGKSVKSGALVEELAREQTLGQIAPAAERLPEQTGLLTKRYPANEFPGHAAWIDGDLKLHRIEKKPGEVVYELYNLYIDARETRDIAADDPRRLERLKSALDSWLGGPQPERRGLSLSERTRGAPGGSIPRRPGGFDRVNG